MVTYEFTEIIRCIISCSFGIALFVILVGEYIYFFAIQNRGQISEALLIRRVHAMRDSVQWTIRSRTRS